MGSLSVDSGPYARLRKGFAAAAQSNFVSLSQDSNLIGGGFNLEQLKLPVVLGFAYGARFGFRLSQVSGIPPNDTGSDVSVEKPEE